MNNIQSYSDGMVTFNQPPRSERFRLTSEYADENNPYRRRSTGRRQSDVDQEQNTPAAEASRLATSEFLATICHEIRNPVSAMVGMMDLALRTTLSKEQKEYLSLMKISSGLLLNIVNETLDLSKIEAGRMEVECINFSLRDCLGDVIKVLAFEAQKKGLVLAYDIAPGIPDALRGDPGRLCQVIFNLAGNAIKFTEKGDVVIRVESQHVDANKVRCRFTVTDSGPGIPESRLAAIFEPFRQADVSTSRIYGGTGLGLHIAARLVQMMHGTLRVDSRLGHGSSFSFALDFDRQRLLERGREDRCFKEDRMFVAETHLPTSKRVGNASRQGKLEAEAVGAAVCCASGAQGLNLAVLLVDDDPLNRRLSRLILEKEGCRVLEAESAIGALELLAREAFDLVLMDLHMPLMSGGEATMMIHQRERTNGNHIPVIALTAYAMERDRECCFLAGMAGCLTKPIQPATLGELIERLIVGEPSATTRHFVQTIDKQALFEATGENFTVLEDVVNLFPEASRKVMERIQEAIRRHEIEAFAFATHKLLGMLRNIFAIAAQDVAARLHGVDIVQEPDRAEAIYALLEKEIQILKIVLAGIDGELAVPKPVFRRVRRRRQLRSMANSTKPGVPRRISVMTIKASSMKNLFSRYFAPRYLLTAHRHLGHSS